MKKFTRINCSYDLRDAEYCGGQQRQDRMFVKGYEKEYQRCGGWFGRKETIWEMLIRLTYEYEEVIFCWEANPWNKKQRDGRVYFAMVRGKKKN